MEENRFKQLRYHDKECFHQKISMTQLALKMGISKATISNLEASDDYDASVSTIRKYKEQFPEVSYDFLLGATNTRHKQYNAIEETLPFNNEFYDNLQKLLDTTNPSPPGVLQAPHNIRAGTDLDKEELELLVNTLFKDPDALHTLLLKTFEFLFDLYKLENMQDDDSTNSLFESPIECRNSIDFGISQAYLNFVRETFYEFLIPYFKNHFNKMKKIKYTEGYFTITDDFEEFPPFV